MTKVTSGPTQFDGHRFRNLSGRAPQNLLAVMRWLASRKQRPWPKQISNSKFPTPAQPSPGDCSVTFINHSTFLIQTSQFALLTDPIFSERASPLPWAGPRRVREPGLPLESLPKIDFVLLSHNHYDHLDLPTLKQLRKISDPIIVTSIGNGAVLARAGCRNVEELGWWESAQPLPSLRVTATPAEHFSGRGLLDRDRALWAGFMLECGPRKIFFAGDSGYGSHFQTIREELGKPDIAFLPIGAYLPRWFMQNVHMDPEEAVCAHVELAAECSIGMHFGTFPLADEGPQDPITDLAAALGRRPDIADSFHVLGFGETRIFS